MGYRIPVHMNGTFIYEIVMETGFDGLKEELKKLNLGDRKICIVTDSNVAPLYLEEVETIVSACCKKKQSILSFLPEKKIKIWIPSGTYMKPLY